MKDSSALRRALSTLHLFLTAVVIVALVEPSVVFSYISDKYAFSFYGYLLWVILIPLKIYVFAGILGCFAALTLDPRVCIGVETFQEKARKYWPPYLLLSCLPVFLHFLMRFLFPSFPLELNQVFVFLDVFILYVMARHILRAETGVSFLPESRKFVSREDIGVLAGLYLLGIATLQFSRYYAGTFLEMERVFVLVQKYITLLMFCYIAELLASSLEKTGGEEGRELYLVNPPAGGPFLRAVAKLLRGHCPVFQVLRALTPADYKVREFNGVLWRDQYYASGKLVAVTCFTCNCSEAYKIAKEFRRRGSTVVMGGPHVTHMPDEALEFCDSVVIGDAEMVWKQLLRDYEQGALKPRYHVPGSGPFPEEIFTALLKLPPLKLRDYIQSIKGCKFNCRFCTIPGLSGHKLTLRPIEQVVELLRRVKEKKNSVMFIDNNIYADPEYARELFTALKPLKMKWSGSASIDIAADRKVLQLARESGCQMLLIGYEISAHSPERARGGKFAMADKYLKYSQRIKKAGIRIKAHFIYAFEHESLWNLLDLWWFAVRLWPYYTVVSMLTPFPGTRLYRQMAEEDRLINLNWKSYTCQRLVYDHPRISPVLAAKLHPAVYTGILVTASGGGCFLIILFFGAVCFVRILSGAY